MWQEGDCLIWWRKGMLDADMALYIKTIRFVRRTPFQIKVDFFSQKALFPIAMEIPDRGCVIHPASGANGLI